MKTVKTYYQIFSEICDNLRLRGDVIGIVDNINDTYTFTSTNISNILIGRWIALNGFDAQVIDIQDDTIIVKAASGFDLTNVNSFVRLDPYFNADVQQRTTLYLSLKDTNKTLAKQKFPLFELVLNDINSTDNFYETANYDNIEIVFSIDTKENYTGVERIQNSFDAVLYPLYFNFCKLLYENKYLIEPENIEIERKDIFLACYGNYEKNQKNHFVDAIKLNIKNVKIPLLYTCINKNY